MDTLIGKDDAARESQLLEQLGDRRPRPWATAQTLIGSGQRQNLVQCRGDLFQLIGLVGIAPYFRGDESVVTDLDQGGHHRLPIYVPFEEIGDMGWLAATAQLDILEVNAPDAADQSE